MNTQDVLKQAKIYCEVKGRELFIHRKAMVPYVQLSSNCRIGFWHNENKICSVIKLSSPPLVEKSLAQTAE